MGFDLDAYEERAAIMEFDGGLSRFRAETLAAQAQGVARHDANRIRNIEQERHQREAASRYAANNMPGVQRGAAKEKRHVPIGDVLAGWGSLALLALLEFGGRVL